MYSVAALLEMGKKALNDWFDRDPSPENAVKNAAHNFRLNHGSPQLYLVYFTDVALGISSCRLYQFA